MGSNFNMHSIKRAARKEAWYSDSLNPFRKTLKSSTWGATRQPGLGDLEQGRDLPASRSMIDLDIGRPESHGQRDEGAKSEERDISKDSGGPVAGRPSDPESSSTVVARLSTQGSRPPSEEQKARQRFLMKFRRGHKEESAKEKEDDSKTKASHRKKYTVQNQIQATIFNSWINILILAAPVGVALNYAGVSKVVVFVVNFIAIIPLAAMLSFATEEISVHVGQTLGGLLNASFGNAVELIVAIIALTKKEVTIVQTSLIGSILSNLLLVMGMCFFFGGLRRPEQYFNETVAQTATSLLALAVGSVIIPTVFDIVLQDDQDSDSSRYQPRIAAISRGTAVILLVVYASYLYFQLHTHNDMFAIESKKVAMKPRKNVVPEGSLAKGLATAGGMAAGPGRATFDDRSPNDEILNPNANEEAAEEEEEDPQLHVLVAWATLAISTAIIGLCAEFMVDSISALTATGHISTEFVGLILLPIVGNAAEHATAVTVACKDKMDLAIGVAVGSSMQVALLLLPLMVVIGWIMGQELMDLSFDGFQVAVMFVAVLLVNYNIADGKSNYIEGLLLCCLYIIIAVCAFYYPAA